MVIKTIKNFENVNFRGWEIPKCGKNLVVDFPNLWKIWVCGIPTPKSKFPPPIQWGGGNLSLYRDTFVNLRYCLVSLWVVFDQNVLQKVVFHWVWTGFCHSLNVFKKSHFTGEGTFANFNFRTFEIYFRIRGSPESNFWHGGRRHHTDLV